MQNKLKMEALKLTVYVCQQNQTARQQQVLSLRVYLAEWLTDFDDRRVHLINNNNRIIQYNTIETKSIHIMDALTICVDAKVSNNKLSGCICANTRKISMTHSHAICSDYNCFDNL